MTPREPQATTQPQPVRASRNTLCEKGFRTRHKECVSLEKAIFPRFAQSSLFNVARQGVEHGQVAPAIHGGRGLKQIIAEQQGYSVG